VTVYPNPSTGMITLIGLQDYTNLSVYNVDGIEVYNHSLDATKNQKDIDLSSESVGIYYIMANGLDKTSSLKFILLD